MKKSLLLIPLVILILGCSTSCPDTCNDGNPCTTDYCSEETNFRCVNDLIMNCCGNDICEDTASEDSQTCALDCPICDDGDMCTTDSFVYSTQSCTSVRTVFLAPFIDDDFTNAMANWYDIFGSGAWKVGQGLLKLNFDSNNDPSVKLPYFICNKLNIYKSNYYFGGKFKIEDGILILLFRSEGTTSGYKIYLRENKLTLTRLKLGTLTPTELVNKPLSLSNNQWYNFGLVAAGNVIQFYLDDTLIFDIEDSNPILTGNFGFAAADSYQAETYEGAIGQVDDVVFIDVTENNYECWK